LIKLQPELVYCLAIFHSVLHAFGVMPEISDVVIFFSNFVVTSSGHGPIIPIPFSHLLNKKFTEIVYVLVTPMCLVIILL